jgi:aminopeptidase N
MFFSLFAGSNFGQKLKFSHADSLKGSYGAARSWWDLKYYELSVDFNLKDSTIKGTNRIIYTAIQSQTVMQLDLMRPMQIDSIIHYSQSCKFKRDGNAYFVELPAEQLPGVTNEVFVYFHGKPLIAKMPPWDGGVVWTKDDLKQDWVSIACQGMAAQVWFPNKDHMADEPDGCLLHYTVPADLIAVGNGKMTGLKMNADNTSTYTWKVQNPINNYCIIPYIGKYSNFHDTIKGEGGTLDLDFWVLDQNLTKARQQFKQVKSMLHCFEYWFGKYPFYEDGYKLVEAPYLGMEHQSAIAYGNGFVNGYKGRDLSSTGWGLKWDFIIVHESGHEWFGNSISAKDVADNWIHESFTAYAENLYTEYLFGKKAGAEYVIGTRKSVMNDKPIISTYNVNAGGSIDLYYKGANMLHTIRQLVDNDSLWRAMLRGLNSEFFHQTVTSAQIENYISKSLKMDLSTIFNQYLRTTRLPALEYKKTRSGYEYRYTNVDSDFSMRLKVAVDGEERWIQPTERWQEIKCKQTGFVLNDNFYVQVIQN